ncbi:zinc finger BED domain-containing protein 5-like [Neodiprion pinetum]|uniref:zinc finger BED domain-containing protein 5-like n=1 Tax=Neodiprion pinetum TaxID=441929 RepID=UPI00370FBD9F
MASDSDSVHSDSNEEKRLKKPQKKPYAQKYMSSWEKDPLMEKWLARSKINERHFHCKVCNADYTTVGGRSNLLKHRKSSKHVQRATTLRKQPVINNQSFKRERQVSHQIKYSEIRIAAFMVEHNIALNTADHLTKLIKAISPDSEVAKGISCSRTKCTKIVQNVTGYSQFEQIVQCLQTTKFSLLVDESTDVSATKHLALVVRFFNNGRINDVFLALIPTPIVTAQALYDHVIAFFKKHNIPYKSNMIGFASDGASNMFGTHHSLSVLLKKDIPHLFLMKCICHSFALCANYACEKLPRVIEDIARDVFNYIQHSYKRLSVLKQFQEFLGLKPHKLLHPSQTRWLSLLQVVKRLLEQYDALILFFTDAVYEDKVLAADMILSRLKEKYVKIHLQFLEYVLPYFTNLNLEMQSEETKIHQLYSRVSTVYKTLLNCFLKSDYVRNTAVERIVFDNPHNFVVIEEVYLGAKVTASISNGSHGLSLEQLSDFRLRCLQFYIEACKQLVKRFNFQDPNLQVFKELGFLDSTQMRSHNSIAPLASKFPNLVHENALNDLDSEWRELKNLEINVPLAPSIDYWETVSKLKLGDGSVKFHHLSDFVRNLHCLPHSSAAVERIFSQIQLNKTKVRNRLEAETLSGILHTKTLIGNDQCFDFVVNPNVIDKHSLQMYN